ncbi:PDZ and LIM domain protein 2 isoform X2 [Oxyura jamaicensis]|uniref:PDZ and LIM domain protein 2 isoform X2 n=1 Tax=Oxyura jamaicensis TaxID=8884 RepID=UPI0015A596D4|nr:PDZ and LIM domain protein 2 isoform X2 [Oxyura jamaicensis]
MSTQLEHPLVPTGPRWGGSHRLHPGPGGRREEAVAAGTLRRREAAGPLPGRKALPGPSTPLPGPLRCGVRGSPLPHPLGTPNFLTPQPPARAEPPAAMPVTVTLAGPAPWGFRITGGRDFGKPITVSKVMEQGKAAAGDLRPGDVIVSINGESAAEMLNVEAQNKIKQSPGQLRLQVERFPLPSPSHTNGDSSPDRLAARFQDTVRMREEGSWRPPPFAPQPVSPISPSPRLANGRGELGLGGHGSQPLPSAPEELPRPGLPQEPGSLSHHNSSPGPLLPPSPQPPSPPNLWEMGREQRLPSPSPGPRSSPGPEPAMRRLEEDSEVYKMLQENRELRAAPRQSSTFRLLQEALEDEGGAGPAAPFPSRLSPSARKPVAGVQKLHTCEKCGSSIATQAVRIQEGRYRHPACYACSDCGLNLKMRGHFWVGDEMYCEKHARLRYQGALGGPSAPPAPTPS